MGCRQLFWLGTVVCVTLVVAISAQTVVAQALHPDVSRIAATRSRVTAIGVASRDEVLSVYYWQYAGGLHVVRVRSSDFRVVGEASSLVAPGLHAPKRIEAIALRSGTLLLFPQRASQCPGRQRCTVVMHVDRDDGPVGSLRYLPVGAQLLAAHGSEDEAIAAFSGVAGSAKDAAVEVTALRLRVQDGRLAAETRVLGRFVPASRSQLFPGNAWAFDPHQLVIAHVAQRPVSIAGTFGEVDASSCEADSGCTHARPVNRVYFDVFETSRSIDVARGQTQLVSGSDFPRNWQPISGATIENERVYVRFGQTHAFSYQGEAVNSPRRDLPPPARTLSVPSLRAVHAIHVGTQGALAAIATGTRRRGAIVLRRVALNSAGAP